jgi:OmpA-OmpF porin, OOP family
MPSSRRRRPLCLAALLAASALSWRARAQQQAQGFAVERFYPSAPGGGWFVMDDLDMRGGLGGAMEVQGGYARNPLRVTDGVTHLAVVSDEAFADLAFAATYDRWRLYLNVEAPLVISGQSGTIGDYQFTAPTVNVTKDNPDTLSDPRFGLDVRILGGPKGPFRLGAGAQLFVPVGATPSVDGSPLPRLGYYDTDGTFRGMLRLLVAGDIGHFTYAGQLGVHIRPLDDSPTPGGPRGSELLFGLAAGARVPVGNGGGTVLVVGAEIYGETAFSSFFGTTTTGIEGLLTGRLEGTADDGAQLRAKLGIGAGLDEHFGAPEWRIVFGIEPFDHNSDRDKDGVSDSKDACPDTPGVKTRDPKTNGCPADPDPRRADPPTNADTDSSDPKGTPPATSTGPRVPEPFDDGANSIEKDGARGE